jgi:hypothetical protein
MEILLERELERVGALTYQIEGVRFLRDIENSFLLYRLGGRSYRFEPNSLQEWLEKKADKEYSGKDIFEDLISIPGYRGV